MDHCCTRHHRLFLGSRPEGIGSSVPSFWVMPYHPLDCPFGLCTTQYLSSLKSLTGRHQTPESALQISQVKTFPRMQSQPLHYSCFRTATQTAGISREPQVLILIYLSLEKPLVGRVNKLEHRGKGKAAGVMQGTEQNVPLGRTWLFSCSSS